MLELKEKAPATGKKEAPALAGAGQGTEACAHSSAPEAPRQVEAQEETEPSTDQPAPFPLEALGGTLEAMGRAICATVQVPESLAGPILLGVTSAAIGKGLEVASGPEVRTRGNLFLLVSAESGTGKSRVFELAARPFLAFEAEYLKGWQETELPRFRARKEVLEAEIASLKRRAGKKDAPELTGELEEKFRELGEVEAGLVPKTLRIENATSEALAGSLEANQETIASLSPDARGVLDVVSGRYQKGSGTDEALYLSAFSGDPCRFDRRGRPPVSLAAPCATVLWLCQPDKLEALLQNKGLSDSGLLPRFLLCHSQAEPQLARPDLPAIPEGVKAAYDALIRGLLEVYRLAECPATLRPTEAAQELLLAYHNSTVAPRQRGGALRDIAPYLARHSEQAWRVAVVLHAAKHGKGAAHHELDEETAQRAVAIARWFAARQLEILAAGREKAREDKQAKVLTLLAQKPTGISAREIQRRRIEPDAASARALLARMEADGLLTSEEHPPEKGGKPVRIYRFATAGHH